jgi:hypothetical protein
MLAEQWHLVQGYVLVIVVGLMVAGWAYFRQGDRRKWFLCFALGLLAMQASSGLGSLIEMYDTFDTIVNRLLLATGAEEFDATTRMSVRTLLKT